MIVNSAFFFFFFKRDKLSLRTGHLFCVIKTGQSRLNGRDGNPNGNQYWAPYKPFTTVLDRELDVRPRARI